MSLCGVAGGRRPGAVPSRTPSQKSAPALDPAGTGPDRETDAPDLPTSWPATAQDRLLWAFIVPPLAQPPHLLVGVSGFGESLTFCAGYHRGQGEDPVERLIDGLFRGPPWEEEGAGAA